MDEEEYFYGCAVRDGRLMPTGKALDDKDGRCHLPSFLGGAASNSQIFLQKQEVTGEIWPETTRLK